MKAVDGLVRAAVRSYRRSGFKPFKGALTSIYNRFRGLHRKETVVATIDGITFELDLNETIDSAIYYDGVFELNTTRVIEQCCKQGMVVLDVGANIGCHTLRCAKLVGPRGQVIAFEPMSWAFSKLARNVALNKFSNIVLEKVALSDESKENQDVHFASSWPLSGVDDALLHPVHRGYASPDVVTFVTLDDYVRVKGLQRIDFVKIDVDGYEFKVVRGATGALMAWKPMMIMELGVSLLKETGDRSEDLVALLSDLGYRFYSEKNLKRFDSLEGMLGSIPDNGAMNVVLSVDDL